MLDLSDEPFDADDAFLKRFPDASGHDPDEQEEAADPEEAGDATPGSDNRASIQRLDPTPELLGGVARRFQDALGQARVVLDTSNLVASLAAMYSSQFLLFAGPSGTGKSTLARCLMDFCVPDEAQATIEARRQLVGPEDLVGFLSPFSTEFAHGSELAELSRPASDNKDAASPSVLVEEINLSTIEGYLAPFTHGLSSPSAPLVEWQLYPESLAVDGLDPVLNFQPFPRLLGTINVDATAMAPSPKVAARACVLLLLPSYDRQRVEDAAVSLIDDRVEIEVDEQAMRLVGDPLAVLRRMDQSSVDAVIEEVHRVVDDVRENCRTDRCIPSRRQLAQMVVYTSWFVWIAEGFTSNGGRMQQVNGNDRATPVAVGAENAFAHFVLPSLKPEVFSEVMDALEGESPPVRIATPPDDEVGSLLGRRFADFAGGAAVSGRFLDFWDRLS